MTPSVVLHSRRYGDTSRIVVLFTEEYGKVSVVARGSRMPKSSYGSTLEPLTVGRVHVYYKRNRDLHTLGTAEATHTWKHLTSSLEHLEAGLQLCQLILRTQPDGVPAPEVFSLVRTTLESLEGAKADAAYRIGLAARIQLTHFMGFGLQLMEQPGGRVLRVSLEDGQYSPTTGYQLSGDAYAILAQPLMVDTVVSQHDRVEVESFLQHYFAQHLGRRV